MLEKRNEFCKRTVMLHFWCTVCGIICFIPSYVASLICFAVGANSIYLSLLYGAFDEYIPLARISSWWFRLFPVAYVISYFLSYRKRIYIPFLALICADTIFAIFAASYEYFRNNMYGFNIILIDVIISIAYSIITITAVRKYKKAIRKA